MHLRVLHMVLHGGDRPLKLIEGVNTWLMLFIGWCCWAWGFRCFVGRGAWWLPGRWVKVVNGIYYGQQFFHFCFVFICAELCTPKYLHTVSSTLLYELSSCGVWSLPMLQGRSGPCLDSSSSCCLLFKLPVVVLEAGPSSRALLFH